MNIVCEISAEEFRTDAERSSFERFVVLRLCRRFPQVDVDVDAFAKVTRTEVRVTGSGSLRIDAEELASWIKVDLKNEWRASKPVMGALASFADPQRPGLEAVWRYEVDGGVLHFASNGHALVVLADGLEDYEFAGELSNLIRRSKDVLPVVSHGPPGASVPLSWQERSLPFLTGPERGSGPSRFGMDSRLLALVAGVEKVAEAEARAEARKKRGWRAHPDVALAPVEWRWTGTSEYDPISWSCRVNLARAFFGLIAPRRL